MARRPNGEGTFRKRPDGRWEARYYTPDNKQHSLYGKTQKEVREKVAKKLQEVKEYDELDGEDLLVSEWLDIWLKKYTSNIKPATLYAYRSAVRSRIKPVIGDKKLRDLSASHIQNIYVQMQDEGLASKTINDIHGVIHKALNQAVKLHYIKSNVSESCVIPKIETKNLQVMEQPDIIRFLQAIKDDIYADLHFIALFTGMRQSEIIGLSWNSIDFDNGIIRLSRQLLRSRDKSGCYFGSLKNGKERIVYMPSSVIDILKRRKKIQNEERLRGGKEWLENNKPWKDLVFTDTMGGCLKHQNVYRHYKKIVKNLGLEKLRFHDLRHSFATLSLENGDDIKTVQEALGHYTAAFTLKTYAHATKKMRQDSVNRMDSYIQTLGYSS